MDTNFDHIYLWKVTIQSTVYQVWDIIPFKSKSHLCPTSKQYISNELLFESHKNINIVVKGFVKSSSKATNPEFRICQFECLASSHHPYHQYGFVLQLHGKSISFTFHILERLHSFIGNRIFSGT